jgi:hypothetical protein
MAEITTAAPATPAGNATPAPAAAAPTAESAPARRSADDRIAAATKAFVGELEPAKPEPAAAAVETPPLPSTPVAPATEAVLRAEETASAQIRARNELADARKAFDAERAAWASESKGRLERAAMIEQAFEALQRDPSVLIQAIKDGGRPVEEVLRDLYLEAADIDKLPAELQPQARDQRARREIERRQAQVEAELQRERQARSIAEMNSHLSAYRGELASGLAALGDSTPMFRELAQKRPDVAVNMLMDVAGRLALQAKQAGTQLGKPSAGQLADLVEREIAAELEPFGGYYERKYKPPAAAAAAAASAPAPPAAQTIAPSMTDVTPVRRKARNDDERIAAAIRAYSGGN